MLKLNDSKTVVILGSPYFIKQNPQITTTGGDSYIECASALGDLGAFLDELMSWMYLCT